MQSTAFLLKSCNFAGMKPITILAIESSCDDTSAAIIQDGVILSNITNTQKIHEQYGGVVPEMASRAHLQHIIPVVDAALKAANVSKSDLSAVACTQAPGLLGSLIVGMNFAKGLAQGLNIPLITVNHMQAHIHAHWAEDPKPNFPFLCLTVSGGHTQIVLCKDFFDVEVIGKTIDDAAGEAFDKSAKMLGLPYPGGPLIDKYAKSGNPQTFTFIEPSMPGYDYSFSGLKTSILYFLQKQVKENPLFIEENLADLCASIQHTIINILFNKYKKAIKQYQVEDIGIAGGVSANSGLRTRLQELGNTLQCRTFIPAFQYCTDNAGMIAVTAYQKYIRGYFASLEAAPMARMPLTEM